MKYFKLKFKDGTIEIKKAESVLALIKEHDLATKKHISTSIFELSGEQLAIAQSNDSE
jgi:hypothetical protein